MSGASGASGASGEAMQELGGSGTVCGMSELMP